MARRLELRRVVLDQANGGGDLAYGELMLIILRTPPAGQGVGLDDMNAALAVIEPIEHAVAAGEAAVTLSDEQWAVLRQKLDLFRFAIVDREVARFGAMIREAGEIGLAGPVRAGDGAFPPRIAGNGLSADG